MREGSRTIGGIVLAALAMSVGWGIRGDYGHEAGAMIPGALLGLAVCVASGREDLWRRAAVVGMCGAIGWAFGGQMSYGRVIGYTASSSMPDVLYGYACLFVIGGLWAGIGSAVLTLGVTQPASDLERFARPLVVLGCAWFVLAISGLTGRLAARWSLNDTDWVGASSALLVAGICALLFPSDRKACVLIAVLAGGWWAGYLVLTVSLGLHMTPPRSDNWAGSVGLFIALILYLRTRQDHTTITAAGWGFLIGGIGFVLGDFANMLGRAQWGPIGRFEALQGLDTWKWMEQSFGLIMGVGVGAVFLTRICPRTSLATDDSPSRKIRGVALVFLLPVVMWLNLSKNAATWTAGNRIPQAVLGVGSTWWLLAIGVLLAACAVLAIVLHLRAGPALAPACDFGRVQLLFLLTLWIPTIGATMQAMPGMCARGTFLVHASFWVTAGLCSLIVLAWGKQAKPEPASPGHSWRLGPRFWASIGFAVALLSAVSFATLRTHEGPLPGSQLRFETAPSPIPPGSTPP